MAFSILGKERIYEPALPEETTLRPSLSAGPAGASHLLPVPALPGLPVPQSRVPLLGAGWPVPPNCDAEDESEGGTAGWTVRKIPPPVQPGTRGEPTSRPPIPEHRPARSCHHIGAARIVAVTAGRWSSRGEAKAQTGTEPLPKHVYVPGPLKEFPAILISGGSIMKKPYLEELLSKPDWSRHRGRDHSCVCELHNPAMAKDASSRIRLPPLCFCEEFEL